MSKISKLEYLGKDMSVDSIREALEEFKSNTPTTALSSLRSLVKEALKMPVTRLASITAGKKITVVLDSLLKDIPTMVDSDMVFLEKYLIDNNNPVITATGKYPGTVFKTISEEMLYFLNTLGSEQTALLYMLVIYHSR